MATATQVPLLNLDNADDNVKRAVVVLLKAAEVAQQKGAFTLDDAALIHSAKKVFVGAAGGDEGEGK